MEELEQSLRESRTIKKVRKDGQTGLGRYYRSDRYHTVVGYGYEDRSSNRGMANAH